MKRPARRKPPMIRFLILLGVALLCAPSAIAQNLRTTACGSSSPSTGYGPLTMDEYSNLCVSLTGAQSTTPTTFQGTMTLAAATSTALTSGNVTMQIGSLPAAGSFAKLVLIAPANCTFTVNLNGSTITAATQGEQFGAGTNVGTDTYNLTGLSNAPTLWSSSGCSSSAPIQFRN